MDDDWDLQAVVRGCTATTTTAASSSSCLDFHPFSTRFEEPLQQAQNDNFLCFQNPFEPRNEVEELCNMYKPFFTKPSPPQKAAFSPKPMPASSPLSVLGAFQDLSSSSSSSSSSSPQQLNQQLLLQQTQVLKPKQLPSSSVPKSGFSATASSNGNTHTQSPRSKRRKNQMKRVCQVPAAGLSSDMWSWRKYGQKPIKGSPYPRGYYRCSTSKGCLARKQVERNRSDPNMFIVTYTAEHNHPMPTHRNSLAGSTRQKPTNSGEPNKPTSSLPASPAASLSPAPEKLESSREEKDELIHEEDEDDDLGISDMPLDDDFFAGLDVELPGTGPAPPLNDCFSDNLPSNGQFSWLANSAAATTAAGGR